eukprot:GDKJ01014870.1.p1 GENE.GDKJ01014870.1~~GDKJ01014870.1.p1  ORF type:complete len:113 (-),score=0.37 GDKJ01014870.1:199-537(-)
MSIVQLYVVHSVEYHGESANFKGKNNIIRNVSLRGFRIEGKPNGVVVSAFSVVGAKYVILVVQCLLFNVIVLCSLCRISSEKYEICVRRGKKQKHTVYRRIYDSELCDRVGT